MTVRDVTDLFEYERQREAEWQRIRRARAYASQQLRAMRIVPTRQAIDDYLGRSVYSRARCEEGWL